MSAWYLFERNGVHCINMTFLIALKIQGGCLPPFDNVSVSYTRHLLITIKTLNTTLLKQKCKCHRRGLINPVNGPSFCFPFPNIKKY